jgi:hypothetical protein
MPPQVWSWSRRPAGLPEQAVTAAIFERLADEKYPLVAK